MVVFFSFLFFVLKFMVCASSLANEKQRQIKIINTRIDVVCLKCIPSKANHPHSPKAVSNAEIRTIYYDWIEQRHTLATRSCIKIIPYPELYRKFVSPFELPEART